MLGRNLKVEGCASWIMDEETRYLQCYTFPLTALFIFFFVLLHLIFCCFKLWKLLSSFSVDKRSAVDLLTHLSSSHSAAQYIEAHAVSWDFLLLYPGVVFKTNHTRLFYITSVNCDPHWNVVLNCRYETCRCLYDFVFIFDV